MSILSRPRLLPQQRFDLEDFEVLLSGLCRDSEDMIEQFWSESQYILKGFIVSGLNAPSPVTIDMSNATLLLASSTSPSHYSWWTAENSPDPISVTLQPGVRNYIELELVNQNNTPLTRAFWDPSANEGAGSEFNQITDTVTDTRVNIVTLTGGFSGSVNRIPLYIIDTDGGNTVKLILDKRPLFFRLGTPNNPLNNYSWGSQAEPVIQLALTGVSGTFTSGETITFSGGATAKVVMGGTSSITCIIPSSDSLASGNTVTGGDSTATGTVNTINQITSGADKSISNVKEMFDAMATEIKRMKGQNFWFETWNYQAIPSALLAEQFTSSASFYEAIWKNTANINDLAAALNTNVYDEFLTFVAGAPANDNEETGPVMSGTILDIPLDSRDSNSAEQYIVGSGILEVYHNGQALHEGIDWTPVGAPTTLSSQIMILKDMAIGEYLRFRVDTAGGFLSSSGGSPDSLQTAYAIGNVIVTSSGVPVTINGPSGEKLLVVNGDIEVTGVIDPLGIQYTPTGTDPFNPSDYGTYVDNLGNLLYRRPSLPDVNLSEAAAGNGQAQSVKSEVENNSGAPLTKATPVSVDSSGDLTAVDVSDEASVLAYIGVMNDDTPDGDSGEPIGCGLVKNITTSFNFGDAIWISKTGILTNLKPQAGSNGFIAGDFAVKVGVIMKNVDNGANKDLMVIPTLPLQL